MFFAAGADEVCFCYRDGRMEFFGQATPEISSSLCFAPLSRSASKLDKKVAMSGCNRR